VGSTPNNPINLKENGKVQYTLGMQDNRTCALEVVMLGADGKPLPIHAGAKLLEEKKKSYYVTAEGLGLRVHAESWPGLKKTLEDRYTSDEALEELGVYFGLFDGHGGAQVAEHAQRSLHKGILQSFRKRQVQPASRDEKIKSAVKEAFLEMDKEICQTAERKKFELAGCTAVAALFHGNPKLGTALRLVVANVGDSRAILCRAGQAIAVTEDHKPNRIDEKKRIERAGGLILQVRGTWRVAASTNPNSMSRAARKEYQGLAMTRSIGDLYFKTPTPLAIPDPEMQVVPLTDKDLFLVMLTDGIVDVMSNQDVVDLVLKHWQDPEEAAKLVVRTAHQKGSDDNLTVLVIQFGWADKNVPRYIEKRKLQAQREKDELSDKGPVSLEKAVDEGVDMFG
jgi:protein phosphatase 1L